MDFDHFTIALLILRPDAPHLGRQAADALQDAHMNHLAELHEAGHLLAAGPLAGGEDSALRGLSILGVDPQRARELKEADPAVKAGRYHVTILPWTVPSGAIAFHQTRFPHSIGEATGG